MKPYIALLTISLVAVSFTVWASNTRRFVNFNGRNKQFYVDTTQKKINETDTSKISLPNSADTSKTPSDSMKLVSKDTTNNHIKISKEALDANVDYKAKDSIVYDIAHRVVYLYGEGKVTYKTTNMTADHINMDWKTSTVSGETKKDSLDQPIGDVTFIEGKDTYFAKKLAYNFKSKKGKVTQARTKQDEGYVHLEQGKRNEYEEWYGKRGWYTTCDLEHPHFYIEASKLKLVPKKVIVTGPAHLVVHDVPTFLYIPFGLFPAKQGRHSGIILPQYGEEQTRGFYFRNGGYYFGISDNFDLALTGDIYTKGSWALKAESKYIVRYKYNGNFYIQYGRNNIGEPEAPNFNVLNDFKVNWVHNQDPKAMPDSRFTANVNFGTSTYDKNFSYSQASVTNSQLASKISYSRTWGNKPFSLGININHDQNLNTHLVNLTLPQLSFAVNRITPFKKQVSTSQPKWYETLGLSYNFETQNIVSGTDSTFFKSQTFKNSKLGARHSIPISASIKLFKYFTLSPSVNYTERWYIQTIREHFVADTTANGGSIALDTVMGFKAARDFNANLALTTKVFGMLQFKKAKIKAIRHVMTPSVSFQYHPDFSKPFWGNYQTVQYKGDGSTQRYSIYQQGVYGDVPAPGTQAGLNFSLSNSLEMKVFSKKDSIKNEKKIKLLENFTISTFYNFAADSLNLSPVNISGYTTLFEKFRINFSTILDPYEYNQQDVRINRFVWQDQRRFFSMRNAAFSLSTSLQSAKGGALNNINNSNASAAEKEMIMKAPSLYYDFTIPWSINFSYNLNVSRGIYGHPDSLFISANSIRIDADVTITEKWKIHLESGYDFNLNDLVYTRLSVIRNMHCWEFSARWVPYPLNRQSYDMQLNVKSAVLQDLKLTRKKSQFDSAF